MRMGSGSQPGVVVGVCRPHCLNSICHELKVIIEKQVATDFQPTPVMVWYAATCDNNNKMKNTTNTRDETNGVIILGIMRRCCIRRGGFDNFIGISIWKEKYRNTIDLQFCKQKETHYPQQVSIQRSRWDIREYIYQMSPFF